jgi:hypothetical protein
VSTVGPFLKALKVLWIAEFAATPGFLVTYGLRAGVTPNGRLTIGNVTGKNEAEAFGPIRPMAEEYDVACLLSFTVNGEISDQEMVSDTVMGFYERAERAVRASPSQTLGVPGVMLANVEGDFGLKHAEASETGGPINSTYEFNVHVQARYQLT